MLSVVFVCIAAADAQEISQFDNSYPDLCDTKQHKVWYGNNANSLWDNLSNTYANNLDSVNRFYGKDITVAVPIPEEFTIFPSAANISDVVHNWSSPVSDVTVSMKIPFDQLSVTPEKDTEITVHIPSDQLNSARLNEGGIITATIPSSQLDFMRLDATDMVQMAVGTAFLPTIIDATTSGMLPALTAHAQLAPWSNAATGMAAAGGSIMMTSLGTAADAATTGAIANGKLDIWLNAAGLSVDCMTSRSADFATSGVLDVPTDQLAAALSAGTVTTTMQIPYGQLLTWFNTEKGGGGTFGSMDSQVNADFETTSVRVPYDQLVKLNKDTAITAQLHLNGIFRNCSTPDPNFLWEQFLIRSKGEIVICQ